MMARTAPSTANTAAARSPRVEGPVTECRVLPSGGPEPGQRYPLNVSVLRGVSDLLKKYIIK